jgi:hypothetical protein
MHCQPRRSRNVALVSLNLLTLAIAACAPIPPVETPGIQRTRSFALAPDAAWARILEVMADKRIQLKAVDRESGVIYGEELIPRDPRLADCGRGRSWTALDQTALTLNVFVRENGGGSKVTVNTSYKQMYSSGLDQRFVLCQSTGALEEEIFAALR